MPRIEHGTRSFIETNLALFAAGLATFALLYCVQPLMPEFATDFGVSAASSSLSLSLTTGLLAPAMLVASAFSEAWGRKPMMVASLFAAATLTAAVAVAPGWAALLAVRALTGIALAGLPAVAMAYLGEEMHPRSIGLAMGLYVGGSGLGGMVGRLLTGVLTDRFGWRVAILGIGLLGLGCGVLFQISLPPSRNFTRRPLALLSLLAAFRGHLGDPGLRLLFAEGFLLMGVFVTIYNYIGFRLRAAPFGFSQTEIGLIFTVYLVGIVGSATVGDFAGRVGRRRVLWAAPVVMSAGVLLTLTHSVPLVVAGMALLTFGFFGGHSILSSWVQVRAKGARAQASSLYLFSFYMGSSVVGSLGGVFWSRGGWPGVLTLTGSLLLIAFLLSGVLARIKPLPN